MPSILHVDDEKEDFEVVRLQLQRLNSELEIDWARSAENALSDLKTKTYGCILCDYQMEVMDGLQFLRDLRSKGDTTPFIFLTGQGSEEIAAEALRAGADDYYTKRVGFAHYQRLINSINRVVDAHRQRLINKKAEEKLRESQEIYRMVADLTSHYTFSSKVLPDGSLKNEWTDGEYSRIHGKTDFPHRKDEWRPIIHPFDAELAENHFKSILSNKPAIGELRILKNESKTRGASTS